jgi:hypothetical protein
LGKLAKPTQGPFKIIDVQQLPINGTALIQQSLNSVEHIIIYRLLPSFEHYNWGRNCRTSVIITLWHSYFNTRNHNKISEACQANEIDSGFQLQVRLTFKDFQFVTFFHKTHLLHMRTSEESLRVAPLLHSFTCRRSGTLDWRVTKATSADSSRLIHTILAHSSTLHYHSTLCHHRTGCFLQAVGSSLQRLHTIWPPDLGRIGYVRNMRHNTW